MDDNEIKVLIVDNENCILQCLKNEVETGHIFPTCKASGLEALKILNEECFDIIVMHFNQVNGFDTIREIKGRQIETPIIAISSSTLDSDIQYCFDNGLDDYVCKPFNPTILLGKIKALALRNKRKEDKVIKVGPFSYNSSTLRFYKNDSEIALSSKENALIKLFIDDVNHVFTKEEIYRMIWGNVVVDEQTVVVYINRLRVKIEDDASKPKYIKTVRSRGYRFVA